MNNNTPIRERVLGQLPALYVRNKGDLTIAGWDFQLIAIGNNAFWMIVTEAVGTLLGPENNLAYSYAMLPVDASGKLIPNGRPILRQPTEAELNYGVKFSCERLRVMRQLQHNSIVNQQQPPGTN